MLRRTGSGSEEARATIPRTSLNRKQSFYLMNKAAESNDWSLKAWLFLEHPTSSVYAHWWSMLVTFTIILSSVIFVIETLPAFYVAGPHSSDFAAIEVYSIIVFTIEYFGRLICFPTDNVEEHEGKSVIGASDAGADAPVLGPKTNPVVQYLITRFSFMRKLMNLIDLMAVAPFYIELILNAISTSDSEANGLAVVRVVRITRIFRLLKLGKHNDGMEILIQTMQASSQFLVSVLFLMLIITVLYASVVFFFETSAGACIATWECIGGETDGADCTVFTEFQSQGSLQATRSEQAVLHGEYMLNRFSGSSKGAPIPGSSKGNSLVCGLGSQCQSVGNVCFNGDGGPTSFNSIPNAMWWCLVTMCCVGFGDMFPETMGGKIFGVFAALTGVIVLAMPTTVIGTNFSDIYEAYYARKREEEREQGKLEHEGSKDEDEEDEDEGSALPEELKGTNSKHLNRLIVAKQLAAQAKDKGIPQDVIDFAFKKESTLTEEREKSLLGSVESFGKEMSSELSWIKLQEDTRIACVDRVNRLIAKRR